MARSASGCAMTWNWRSAPPIGVTCETPGTARRRRRTTVSATVRSVERIDRLRREREEENLAHDGRNRREHRPLHLRRQRARHERELLRHELPSDVDVGAPIELDPDDTNAHGRRRPDAPHTRCAVDRALDRKRDERFHFLRRHPVALGKDRDGGGREIRKDVHRHVARRPCPCRKQDHGQRNHEPVMLNRPLNEPFHVSARALPPAIRRPRTRAEPRRRLA